MEQCEVSWQKIMEIAGVTITILTLIYEIMAARSRDTRIVSPLQLVATGTGEIIYKVTGYVPFGRINKIEPSARLILMNKLTKSTETMNKELWVEKMKRSQSIQLTFNKKQITEFIADSETEIALQ